MSTRHPARWSKAVLNACAEVAHAEADRLDRRLVVLDPFAGSGRRRLQDTLEVHATVMGIELEPEWAEGERELDPDPHTLVGDALALPEHWAGKFDAVVTSPAYGNRMADAHHAKDGCKTCNGEGTIERLATPTEVDAGCELGIAFDPCPACKGEGLSRRNTYRHALGRKPSEGSAAVLQWGREYRQFHQAALAEMRRVVQPGGLLVVNMSNHIRGGREQQVVEWWVNEALHQWCRIVEVRRVATSRQRQGANGDLRVDGEVVIVMRTPADPGLL